MKRTLTMAALIAATTFGTASDARAGSATSNGCTTLAQMRAGYKAMNTEMARQRTEIISQNRQEFDAESTGCIGDWGVNLGLGLSSLADSFLDQLKDQACSAMDDYVNSQLSALNSSITAPLDLAGLDVGFGSDQPFNLDVSQSEIDLDTGKIVDDVFSEAPKVGGGYRGQIGSNPLGNGDLNDIYLNQGRNQSMPAPNWGPSSGGRGQ